MNSAVNTVNSQPVLTANPQNTMLQDNSRQYRSGDEKFRKGQLKANKVK